MAKRGRGRPRKDSVPGLSNGSQVPSSTSNGNPQASAGFPSNGPVLEIPLPVLLPAVSFPFEIAKGKTGFDGWSLSKEEAEILARQLDAVIRQYMPAMNSPHAAAYTLAGTMVMFAGIRYMMYLDWKKEEQEKMKKLNEVTRG